MTKKEKVVLNVLVSTSIACEKTLALYANEMIANSDPIPARDVRETALRAIAKAVAK